MQAGDYVRLVDNPTVCGHVGELNGEQMTVDAGGGFMVVTCADWEEVPDHSLSVTTATGSAGDAADASEALQPPQTAPQVVQPPQPAQPVEAIIYHYPLKFPRV